MKRVPVSKLAEYAADPEGFIARKGQVRSKKAARAGTKHHDRLGTSFLSRHRALVFMHLLAVLFWLIVLS